eukprot:2798087-Amphidinium_carterae.1
MAPRQTGWLSAAQCRGHSSSEASWKSDSLYSGVFSMGGKQRSGMSLKEKTQIVAQGLSLQLGRARCHNCCQEKHVNNLDLVHAESADLQISLHLGDPVLSTT